jgi:hypothetical protein
MLTSINNHSMKLILRAVIILLVSLWLAQQSWATGMPVKLSWQQLTTQQQQILAPLENDWGSLSNKQQNNFIGIAKRYPQLTPLQQQRLQERMVKWSKLTPAQRQHARDKFQSVKKLPPEKREVEKRTLREQQAKKHADAASSIQPASPKP